MAESVLPYFMTDTMDQWLQFLTLQGVLPRATLNSGTAPSGTALESAARAETGTMPGAADSDSATGATPTTDFFAPLTYLGLIAASGDEAAHFLHNQLTNDVEHLGPAEARLAGYCSPKGRLLATMLIWKNADSILLQVPQEILAPLQKRLQMFVLRAKVKLADASAQQVILGLVGERATAALGHWFSAMPPTPYTLVHSGAGTLIRLADANDAPRYQWLTTPDNAQQAWPRLAQNLTAAPAAAWRLSEIAAGVPQITLPTQEKFVPQMVNYELIGGVNFKKGCYPGQEIVARSQYLGKLKRRMLRASVASLDAQAGMEVFSSADPGQPCGQIVNAERSTTQQMECLVELKTAAVEHGSLHLGGADGAVLVPGTLPYALPEPA
jgi:tRNA-modifying protein YgfZ